MLRSPTTDGWTPRASLTSTFDVMPTIDKDKMLEARAWKRKFWWFALVASLNHALNYVVTSYATSLLDPLLGGVILGLTWSLNSLSGLTVATAVVRRFGFKYSMIISLWGYAIQIASLYIAVVTSSSIAWPIAIIGCTIAGFTSAVWWTSQGVYFEHICSAIDGTLYHQKGKEKDMFQTDEMRGGFDPANSPGTAVSPAGAESVGITICQIRADLSAHWTIIYQAADIVVFSMLSLFPLFGGVSITSVLAGLTVMGIVTSLLGFTFDAVHADENKKLSWAETKEAVAAVPQQIRTDARVSLLAPFVFGFGITTAMFAYYVNAEVVSDSSNLGQATLGFLEAYSYFVAVLAAYPYAFVANSFKYGQDFIIQFGSVCFLLTGVIVIVYDDAQLASWEMIFVVKGLYGLGRGVFEGSCRAVYAAMFTGKDLSTAFSGQTLSAGLSGGLCFFLFYVMTRRAIAAVTIVNGVIALLTYAVLVFVVNRNELLPWGALGRRLLLFLSCKPIVNADADEHGPGGNQLRCASRLSVLDPHSPHTPPATPGSGQGGANGSIPSSNSSNSIVSANTGVHSFISASSNSRIIPPRTANPILEASGGAKQSDELYHRL